MRGYIPGLETPHPLGPALPALYQDDDFVQRMLDGLDAVVAPVFSHDRQLRLVPRPQPHARRLPRLARRLGRDRAGRGLGRGPPPGDRRAGRGAVPAPRDGGGLAGQVEIQTGGTVEIVENGATGWSVDPGGELPGSADPLVVVRVTVPDPKSIDAQQLDTLVATAKPAHVMHRIEIVKGAAKA